MIRPFSPPPVDYAESAQLDMSRLGNNNAPIRADSAISARRYEPTRARMGAVTTALPTRIPHGQTARRLEWGFLPPHIRAEVEARLGSPVTDAESQTGGFTPGLRLGADLRRRRSPLREGGVDDRAADVRRRLPRGGPQAGDAAGRRPGAAAAVAPRRRRLGRPRLRVRRGPGAAAALGAGRARGRVRHGGRDRPAADAGAARDRPRGRGVRVLARAVGRGSTTRGPRTAARSRSQYADVVDGDTLVHTDIRDDNLLVRPDGSVVICDWNWPVRGADLARLAVPAHRTARATASTSRRTSLPTRCSPRSTPSTSTS